MSKKIVLKGSIFTVLLISILLSLNWLLMYKTGYRNNLYQGLYADTGDKYDVVFLGSSHMHAAMSPNLLWKNYGITSYNYSTAGEPIDVTYYLLKEILKKQEKPVVVVDLYYLGLNQQYGEDGYIRYVLDNLKFSKNKIDAILATTPKDERLNYFVPFIKYHSRWKEVSTDDIQFNNLDNYYEKGFSVGNEKYGKDSEANVLTQGVGTLPPKSEEYLNKMIDLSKQQGFKLIFTNVPYDDTSTTGMDNWTQTPGKMFNKVEQICKENNIEFIDYNKKYKEIGFDFKNDMFNVGHLNISGSNKVTNYIGELLKTKYELKDNRNDKSYEEWNANYLLFLKNHPIVK